MDATVAQLLACMAKVAHRALECRWKNCGAYTDLENLWLIPLLTIFSNNNPPRTQQMQAQFPHELVASLTRCRDAGLLTGDLQPLEWLEAESQHLRDANDAAEPAKVHGADAPDAEQVQGTSSSAHPDLLSMSRPSSPVLQHFPQMEQHVATIASGSAEFIPDEPLSPSQELDRHSSTSDADPICAPRVSPVPAFSSSLYTPDVLGPVFDTPTSSLDEPAPSTAPDPPLDFDGISTSAATLSIHGLGIGTDASRDLRTRQTRDDAIASTTEDDIKLHELDSSQTIHAQSQAPLMEEEHEHVEHTSMFSIDLSGIPVPSAVPPDTTDLVRYSPTFTCMSVHKHITNKVIHNTEESSGHQALAPPSASSMSAIVQSDSWSTHPLSSSLGPGTLPREDANCPPDARSPHLSLDDQVTSDASTCISADSLFVDDLGDVPLPFASTAGSDRPGAEGSRTKLNHRSKLISDCPWLLQVEHRKRGRFIYTGLPLFNPEIVSCPSCASDLVEISLSLAYGVVA